MQHSNSQTRVQWEWKSNPNPFSQSEKDQWTPYSLFDNSLLEKAYQNNENEVEIGDHIVSIKDRLQRKKDESKKQRPIRRTTVYSEENEDERMLSFEENIRAERFFGSETPKTFNDAFGNLEDYLKFFQNRGPHIREFASLVDTIEADNNLDLLNNDVQSYLIKSIQDEVKKIPMTSNSQKCENKLILLFQKTATNIKQFYANVLKAYTMTGFLYQNLNLYLRNEDWSRLDSLLPYAYCLCKAFLRLEFAPNINNQQSTSMIVYRGARFDEVTLSFYNLNLDKNFCWNGVTSTTKNYGIAKKFMTMNDDKKPISVMFIIEIPLNIENKQSSKWIDISPYSAIPNEDEVVLPPGSVFELSAVSRDKNIVEIHLKLIINIEELAHGGQIMHGAMNSKMGNETSMKLVCLEGKDLIGAITHLKGNGLIEELEFSLCRFDEEVALSLVETLKKTPKLRSLIFIAPYTGTSAHWSEIFSHLEKIQIEKLEVYDRNVDDDQLFLFGQEIRKLIFLNSLTINFSKHEITNEGLNNLSFQGLKYLTSLTSLSLDFNNCLEMTDEGLSNLGSKGIRYLNSLTFLSIDFSECRKITDDGLKHLGFQGIKYLTSLLSLTLNFQGCAEIKDEGLNHLSSQGLKYLTSLKFLKLTFYYCQGITGEGLYNLSSQGITYLTSLTSLHLEFSFCDQITDEGLIHMGSQGIKFLVSLQSLTLNFQGCTKITDEGLKSLSERFKHLTSLTSLALTFSNCIGITHEGLNHMSSQNIIHLTSLTSLSLEFPCCHQILSEGLSILGVQGLKYLTSLQSLTLNFRYCSGITDEGLYYLSCGGIKHLTSLTSLNLEFSFCPQITRKGLSHLGFQGIKDLTSLQSLTLDFQHCTEIKDEGLNHLSSQGLKNLTLLTFLKLSFTSCSSLVTDDGLNYLSSQGINHLTSLKSLTLDFVSCNKITNEGLKNLGSKGLKSLTSLTSLSLKFSECDQITDEGVNDLYCEGIKCLPSLKFLLLNFSKCSKITEKGHFQLKRISQLYDQEPGRIIAGQMSLDFLRKTKNKTLDTTEIPDANFNEPITLDSYEKLQNFVKNNQKLTSAFQNIVMKGELFFIGKYMPGGKCAFGPSLRSLTLDFQDYKWMNGKGLENLAYLKDLSSLLSLTLQFSDCLEMTDEEFKNLISQGIIYLASLQSLTLDLVRCKKITDEGLNHLSFQGLNHLICLKSLNLNFYACDKITDSGLEDLAQGLKNLSSLTSLSLIFSFCLEITDKGLKNLISQGIRYLPSLQSLTLHFFFCNKTTDESLDNLCREGIKYLPLLTSLDLNFDGCRLITDVAFQNFCKMLAYFGFHPVTFNGY